MRYTDEELRAREELRALIDTLETKRPPDPPDHALLRDPVIRGVIIFIVGVFAVVAAVFL